MTADEAREFLKDKPTDELTLLDVRQPAEYENSHIPGAKLIPLPDLSERLDEIDPNKSTLVYCAIGGRSRVAAQMLAGKGFDDIYNLSGGIKAWNGEVALLGEEKGLDLFSGNETPEEALVVAYSLEEGLGDFYITMGERVNNEDAKKLFQQLSEIEVRHQDRIFKEYGIISGGSMTRQEFEEKIVKGAIEGGLTTEEYSNLFQPDWESVSDIIDIAMSIEAQALDLYTRASNKVKDSRSKEQLTQIANEERAHLTMLGEMIPKIS
jgi:rhodanese-related sulfurtransferase/rubrerythrin